MKTNIAREIRIQKLQNKNHMVGQAFSVLGPNERCKRSWLGSYWFTEATPEEREEYIKQYEAETQRLLKLNPNLKIVE